MRLRKRYGAIEQRFPDLRTLESLTLKVGVAPTGRFAKVRHAVPMLSLDNAFSDEDVTRFVDRIRRFLKLRDDETLAFTAEPKIDGLSMSLRYEGGDSSRRDARRRRGGRGRHRQHQDAEGRAAQLKGKDSRQSARCAARST
jgi:NAD-dependent DNA ligase